MPDPERIKDLLRLKRYLLRDPRVKRAGSENIEDLEFHDRMGQLTWKARYEQFEADLNGGYEIDAVEVAFRFLFASRKAEVVQLEIDNVRPKKKVIGLSADEKTKKALVSKLEKMMRKIFEDVLRKVVK